MKRVIRRLKNSSKVMITFYFITIILFLISCVLVDISLIKLSGIETFYRYGLMIILLLLLVWMIIGNYKNVVKRKKTKFIISITLSIILSCILLFCTYTINMVYGELKELTEDESIVYTTNLISLKDTSFTDSSTIGMIKDESDVEGSELALLLIDEKNLENEIIYYDSYRDMIKALYAKTIDSIFVSGNYITLFESDFNTIGTDTKVVYKLSKKMDNKDSNIKSSKKLSEPFTILLMGVDTNSSEGVKSNSSFNGDTLMLISFNPKTLNATVFSIPRDLYVPISCRRNNLSKINSSAVGGTSCVIETIENLTTIDIDYYAKINFKGVVDLVEALGGVEIEVTYPFCEQDSNRSFKNKLCLEKGLQKVNGEEALAFARHRHSLPTGDLTRIQNQQVLVEAIARKAFKLNSLSDVKDVLSAVSNNISINMSTNQILSSYDILKSMVVNTLSGEEAVTLNRSYLEVFDNPVYLSDGSYSATLGYYEKSLNNIIKSMKINLDLEEPELIKTFYFDANTTYEKTVPGKGISTSDSLDTIPDFIGKSVFAAESFCNNHNITLTKEFVKSGDTFYNNNIQNGLIANQSIKSGMPSQNISSMTIYINSNN